MDKALAIQRKVQEILGTEEVYLVGGSVRDLVMGNVPKDYDFTTALTPDEMKVKLKEAGRRAYNVGNGNKHGTVGFKVPMPREGSSEDNFMYDSTLPYEYVEVTTHRTEVYDGKSRQPVVTFGVSLDEDLARRDFTMNAMVLKADGTIYDPYGGRLDIYAKQIKTVGLPKDRIMEDPLRILRAARFAARYDFTIDPNFIGKARHLSDRIYDVSRERWVQELDKLLVSDNTDAGIYALKSMNVLMRILPELYNDNDEITVGDDLNGVKNVDVAWKQLLGHMQLPAEIKEQSRTMRYVNAGICARLKFSTNRQKIILG